MRLVAESHDVLVLVVLPVQEGQHHALDVEDRVVWRASEASGKDSKRTPTKHKRTNVTKDDGSRVTRTQLGSRRLPQR